MNSWCIRSSFNEISTTTEKPKTSTTKRSRKKDSELHDFDDGIDIYDDPPLVCCFGAVQKEFLPTVRVAPEQMPSNVAISHVRLGGRAAFVGKVRSDEFGEELVLMMNKENVQTRGVKFDGGVRTACSFMKFRFEDRRMSAEKIKDCAEDSIRWLVRRMCAEKI